MASAPERPGSDRFPVMQLGHLDNEWHNGAYSRYDYTLHPITVRRPADGKRPATIRCGSCGKPLTCTIYSVTAARWRRRSRFITGVLVLGSLAAVWYASVYFRDHIADWGRWAGLYWTPLGLSSIFIIIAAVASPWISLDECAVRLGRGKGNHELRRPGDIRDLIDHSRELGE
jgi:hypothetical protein